MSMTNPNITSEVIFGDLRSLSLTISEAGEYHVTVNGGTTYQGTDAERAFKLLRQFSPKKRYSVVPYAAYVFPAYLVS